MLDRANSTLNHMNAAFKDDQSLEALIEQLKFQVTIIRQQNIHDRVSLGLGFRSKEHQQPVRRIYDFLKLRINLPSPCNACSLLEENQQPM